MKTYFLRLKHIPKPKGRPMFSFVRGNKRIYAVSDDIHSSRVYARGTRIPDKNLIEFSATEQQLKNLELTETRFRSKKQEAQ